MLASVASGVTTFRVGHRLAELRDSDFIVVIEDGVVSQMGPHDELMDDPGWYREVYLLQANGDMPAMHEEGPESAVSVVSSSERKHG